MRQTPEISIFKSMMQTELILPAPAKLNLFLHILARRPDGYHELQTVFQLLNWGDALHFRYRDDGKILVSQTGEPIEMTQNLAYRAAKLLQEKTATSAGVEIRVKKKIPVGGGMGGGSSDAATTLLGLNKLWQLNLSRQTLQNWSLELGADVPVFVLGHSAWAEGVGDKLTPIDLPDSWFVVLVPTGRINTKSIFNHPQLPRNTKPIRLDEFQSKQCVLVNDCATVVYSLDASVRSAWEWLSRFGKAELTGTGSCVFLRCTSKEQAEQIEMLAIQAKQCVIIAKSENISLVHQILDL